MRTSVELADYVLPLSTGETISVAELDPECVPELRDPAVFAALEPVLRRCTVASREVLEEAKIGGTDRLESVLGAEPLGSLLKLSRPECGERSVCATAGPSCTTRCHSRGEPAFPHCWSYDASYAPESVRAAVSAIADAVVRAWRDGHHVVLVQSS